MDVDWENKPTMFSEHFDRTHECPHCLIVCTQVCDGEGICPSCGCHYCVGLEDIGEEVTDEC